MKLKIFILVLAGTLFLSPYVFAQGVPLDTGRATAYKVTLTQFEIDNGDGSTAVTAFSGTSTIVDIAAAPNTSSSAGNFMSGLTIPDGSYSRAKPTPSGTFTISGTVTYDAVGGDNLTYYTQSAAGPGGGCSTNTVGPAQECTIAINVGAANWDNLGGTITVADGIPDYKVRVRFNTSQMLGLYAGPGGREIFPQQPNPTVELIPNT